RALAATVAGGRGDGGRGGGRVLFRWRVEDGGVDRGDELVEQRAVVRPVVRPVRQLDAAGGRAARAVRLQPGRYEGTHVRHRRLRRRTGRAHVLRRPLRVRQRTGPGR